MDERAQAELERRRRLAKGQQLGEMQAERRRTLELAAQEGHNILAAYKRALGERARDWDQAEDWERESSLRWAESLAGGEVPDPRADHAAWLAERRSQGWCWGPKRDDALKYNPLMVEDWGQLPPTERLKTTLPVTVMARALGVELPQDYGR